MVTTIDYPTLLLLLVVISHAHRHDRRDRRDRRDPPSTLPADCSPYYIAKGTACEHATPGQPREKADAAASQALPQGIFINFLLNFLLKIIYFYKNYKYKI